MKRRTFVLGTAAAAAGGSALLGAGSFSRTEAQRGVVVETVGDEDAYLVLEYQDLTIGCEGELTLVTLTNRFTEPLTDIQVEFTTGNDNVTLTNLNTPDTLGVGESGTVTLDATCSGSGTTAITFTVDATGEETAVTAADRSVTLTCDCSSTTAISLVACCGDIEATAVDVDVDPANDRVAWEYNGDSLSGDPLDALVLYGAFSAYGKEAVFLNFHGVTGTSGTVAVGGEDEALPADQSQQTESCPCATAERGVTFGVAEDGTVETVDDGCAPDWEV